MSESSLSLSRDEIRSEIGDFIGYTRGSTSWNADEVADIDAVLKNGLRQFYYPPIVAIEGNERKTSHQWSFLKPIDTITVWDDIAVVSTSTVTGVYSGVTFKTTLTANVASFYPTMVGKTITITDVGDFTITAYTSTTVIVVSGDASAAVTKTFSFVSDGKFVLPDDFGGIEGDLTYEPDDAVGFSPVKITSEGKIRAMYQQQDAASRPEYAAIIPYTADGVLGQRFQMWFYSIPDGVYVLSFHKIILTNTLTSGNPYPLGGMIHAQTIMSSCLAAAELLKDRTKGEYWDRFLDHLAAGIKQDEKLVGTDYFGYNADYSSNTGSRLGRHWPDWGNLATYDPTYGREGI